MLVLVPMVLLLVLLVVFERWFPLRVLVAAPAFQIALRASAVSEAFRRPQAVGSAPPPPLATALA